MSKNNIKIINPLKNYAFKGLEKLDLFSKEINDISVLKKIPFKDTIEELDLSFNKLTSIEILLTQSFPKLKELKIEANDGLDYRDEKIKLLNDNNKIKYNYCSIL